VKARQYLDEHYLLERELVVRQLTPSRHNLPTCRAVVRDGSKCNFRARYAMDGVPLCGAHVGRPSVVFVPPKKKRAASRRGVS
jgi:hypothetical protein